MIFFTLEWSLVLQEGCVAFLVWGQSLSGIGFSLLLHNLSPRPEFLQEPIAFQNVSLCSLFMTSVLPVHDNRAPEGCGSVWQARPSSTNALMFSQL